MRKLAALVIWLCASASYAAVIVSPWKMAGQNKYLYFCYAALESELPVSATEGAICAADDADAIFVYHDGAWVEVVAGVGGGDSFKTIDAPAGTDPVADSATDTLTLVCTGATCTGDSSTDTLTIAVSGGDPTLAGDVDGLGSANDLDEANVETELEGVLDLADLQGAVTDGQVPDGITVTLSGTASALAANPAACGAGEFANDIAADGTLTCATPSGGSGLTHPQVMTRAAVLGSF